MNRDHYRRHGPALWALALLVFLAPAKPLVAQAGLGAAGGHTSAGDYSLNYSVGQVFHTVLEAPDIYISQGVQHPFLMVIDGSGLWEMPGLDSLAVFFPNPVKEDLFIYLLHPVPREFQAVLLTMKGEVLMQKAFESGRLRLPMMDLAPGAYLLSLVSGEKLVQTYTIIKSH